MRLNWGKIAVLSACSPLLCQSISLAISGIAAGQVMSEKRPSDSGSSIVYQNSADPAPDEKSDLAASTLTIVPASAPPEASNVAENANATQLAHARFASVCGTGNQLDAAAAKGLVDRIAATRGDDVKLAEALIQAESAFINDQVSEKGAIGLSQLTPATAQELGVNPCNPEENVKGGLAYLAQLRAQFGNPVFALAAYNAGPDRIEQFHGVPPFKETLNYVAGILTDYYRDGNAPALTAPINGQSAKARATEHPSKTKPQASEASLADWKSGFVMNLD